MKHYFRVLCCLLILACLALAACRPSMPSADYGACLASHSESDMVLTYGVNPMTGNTETYLMPTSTFVCDRYEYPLGDGPAYHEDVKRYEREMVEYRKDHPNE